MNSKISMAIRSLTAGIAIFVSASAFSATVNLSGGLTLNNTGSGGYVSTTDIIQNGTYTLESSSKFNNNSLSSANTRIELYELNIGSYDKLTTFSLLDTNPDGRTVEYWLYKDDNTNSGAYDISATGALVDHYLATDIAGTIVLGTLNLLANKDYLLVMVATSTSDSLRNVQTQLSAVPLPGAVWLFGTALLGFLGFSNRRKI